MKPGLSRAYQHFILGYPKGVLVALGLLLLFFSYHAKDFKLDASADSLLLEDDKDLELYRTIAERYAVKDFLVVTFAPHADLFSPRSLQQLKELRDEIKRLDRVDSVVSLLDIPLLEVSGVKLADITVESVKTLEDPAIDVHKAKKEILESPMYRDLVLSAEGQTTALLVNLKTDHFFAELSKKKNELLRKQRSAELSPAEEAEIENFLADYEAHFETFTRQRHQDILKLRSILLPFKEQAVVHLGGVPMIADDMITFIKNDLVVFGFGVFVFIVATLAFIFRQVRWVVLPLLSCFFAVLLMIGILGVVNWKVTVISSNFISLMLILTMSMNIHLAVRYRQLCTDLPTLSQTELVATTTAKMVWPCLYTALTTILAFSSLVFSGIRPVIDFGWMMTIGLSVTFLTSFLLFPAALILLKKADPLVSDVRQSAITSSLASITYSHGNKVIFLSIILACSSMVGISKLKVENSFINYFREKTEIYQGMKLIDEKLGGTTPLDIVLSFGEQGGTSETPEDFGEFNDDPFFEDDDIGLGLDEDPAEYWFTPFKIETIKGVHDYLAGLPEVGKVLSLASVIRVAERLNEGKELDGLEMAVMYKKIPEQLRSLMLTPYVSIDHNEARISLRILDSLKNIRRKELLEKIGRDLSEKFGLKEEVTLAGLLVMYNNMLQSLFKSQILTLGIVMLGIAFMLLVLFRSFVLSVIGIIPNLLAVGIVLGIMGLMDIPLDMMTITIAAITMGIAIDNSIHYIYRFREEFAANSDYAKTLKVCHANIGKAILNTSVTIIFGFSILVLSNFIPTIYFGIFTGLAMFIALLAILTLLPKLILLWKPF